MNSRGAEEADKLIGVVLAGRYEVTGVLGAGGMGVVLAARQIAVDRQVAVKLLHPSFGVNRHAVARFVREMQITSRLEHPSTVRVYDFGEATHDGTTYLFLVMELFAGQTLGQVLGDGALDHTRVTGIGAQIARALEAAHGEGIVHRDLKPDNVMLVDRYGQADTVKVLDFGIARFVDGAEGEGIGKLTAEGAVVGTPSYMSPEQATGASIGPASDLYSLGVMLFEMATGHVPFSAPTTVSLMVKHVQEPPPRPSEFTAVRPELEALILACLAKAPDERPKSARAVAEALELMALPMARATPQEGAHAVGTLAAITAKSRDDGPVEGSDRSPPKRGAHAWWVALAVVAVGAALAAVLTRGDELTIAPAAKLDIADAEPSIADAMTANAMTEDAMAAAAMNADPQVEPAAPSGCSFAKVEAARAAVKDGMDAVALGREAVRVCPGWAVAHVALGQAEQAAKDWSAAKRSFARAAELAPSWGLPLYDLALVELASGAADVARGRLDALLVKAPAWPDARLLRAQAGLVMRDFAGARADAVAATEANPTRAEAWFLLGESHRAAGDPPELARAAYCRAKALGMAAAAARCDGP